MATTGKRGNRKQSKKDQPKRVRYNTEQRGFLHSVRGLERHLKKHPEDVQARVALKLAREMVERGGK